MSIPHQTTARSLNLFQYTPQADAAAVIGGEGLTDALGPVDQSTVFAAVADVTAEAPAVRNGVVVKQQGEPGVKEQQRAERRLIPASARIRRSMSREVRTDLSQI